MVGCYIVSAELDEMFTTYSEDFIKRMADSDQPFFLYHCSRGNHFKNYPNPKYKGKSPAKYPYKDCIIELDDSVGRLVKALEDTGQLENTLIFVTSDNGPMMEPWPDSGYTPFRGGIACTWEGGVRVPGVVYWKDMITPGQVNNGLFDLADLFLTSLALAGVAYRPPEEQYLDSIDQTSFLLSDQGLANRKYVYMWLQKQWLHQTRRSPPRSSSSFWKTAAAPAASTYPAGPRWRWIVSARAMRARSSGCKPTATTTASWCWRRSRPRPRGSGRRCWTRAMPRSTC
ncbi:MAG: sulfatase-like hydrolase/transferase [Anaerolineae bacterium]